ncbi:pyridoxamine 5'-phosphate oxidase family protein [Streptomyces sp. NBC_01476]|uniref:pyridoxamine 5'-phosphate oxidase family protein n=1 Tax=Streptomyces sp. NBC_01476 TaxID=2903881 RepID=UPI002E2EAFEC|nr:pyridoxamine 5'-phosphate oxidase family protein [Streptomyces sp. NBC_01476]
MSSRGFHEGEREVQRRAGVEHDAARLEGMLRPALLTGGAAAFLAQRDLAVLTGRDRAGQLWVSALPGHPGFLDGSGTTLRVGTVPVGGDPLHDLPAGQEVGLLAIDLSLRRRVRVNGTLTGVGADGLEIDAEQAYGNCPQYIQRRDLRLGAEPGPPPGTASRAPGFTAGRTRLITAADTFFLGTSHPTRGADASHRGGSPGFVRIDGDDLWWPDYAGNNMFNSLGNLAVDPAAALLFIDFGTGSALQLSGTAALEFTAPGAPGDDGGTGRRVRFHPERFAGTALPLRGAPGVGYSPYNPPLAG